MGCGRWAVSVLAWFSHEGVDDLYAGKPAPCLHVFGKQDGTIGLDRHLNDHSIPERKLMLFGRADVMTPRTDDVVSAARLSIEHKLSFWDAMIVQMAIQADCAVLFSEDMQAGRRFAGVEIVNPFMAGPGKH